MKQRQYSESFKQRMIQRMVGRERISASALSREVGVAQPTLSLWLKSAGKVSTVSDDEKPKPKVTRPEDWTPQKKLGAVMEAARLSDAELGAWLRREGPTEEHLRQWRDALEERTSAVFEPRVSAESRRRVLELERELKRKDKALAETAALLVLQGTRVYEAESDNHAAALFAEVREREQLAPGETTLHSDNGPAMKGATLKATLERLGILASYSRPAVSDDNPCIESLFGTMKTRVGYPKKPFGTIEEAQGWVDRFVVWYNEEHRHGALSWVTPMARHAQCRATTPSCASRAARSCGA